MALRNHIVFWSIAVGVFLLDRITKLLVMSYVPVGASIELLPFLSLTHVLNTGTAFGLLKNAGWLFMVFAAAVSVYVVTIYRRYSGIAQILLALIFAGALGNLLDRLLYGAVIDFIDLHFWPVFNVADSAVTLSVLVLLFRGLFAGKHRKL